MKTNVMERMKKQIAVFASVCIVAGLALTYVACSADEMTAEQLQAEKQFEEELLAFNNQQQQLLDNLRGTRAATGELTEEVFVAVGNQLGENMDAFVAQHSDLLKEYAPKQEITEEELELMKIDQDVFLDYVEENMSQDCYSLISDATLTSNSITTSNLQQYDLNPFESMCLSNMAILDELGEVYAQSAKGKKPLTQTEIQKCHDTFYSDMKSCLVVSGVIGILGSALSWLTGPAAPLTAAGAWKAAASVGTTCAIAAAYKHDECMGSNII